MPSRDQSHQRTALLAALIAMLLAAAALLPPILSGSLRSRAAFDQVNYHEKAVRTFAQELPTPRIDDYLSATTPGYHLTIAALARLTQGPSLAAGADLTPPATDPSHAPIARQRQLMQLTGALFTLALAGLLAGFTAPPTTSAVFSVATAIALTAVVAASPYVWQSGAFMLPDNSAWLACLGVLLATLAATTGPRPLAPLLLAGVLALAAVWFRQIHLWTCAVVWAGAAVCAARPTITLRRVGPLLQLKDLLPAPLVTPQPRTSNSPLAILTTGLLITFPAFASVAWLASLWGGLVPPSFKHWYTTGALQLGAPAFILTLLAGYALALAPLWWPTARHALTHHRAALLVAAASGLALGLLGPTEPGFAQGRFGGIWSLIDLVPSVLGRAPLAVAGSIAGATVVAILLAGLRPRERWVMLAALAGFAAAQSASEQLWQRYSEPWALIWLVVACALVAKHQHEDERANTNTPRPTSPGWRILAPAALALVLATLTALGFARSGIARDEGAALGRIEPAPSDQPQAPNP